MPTFEDPAVDADNAQSALRALRTRPGPSIPSLSFVGSRCDGLG